MQDKIDCNKMNEIREERMQTQFLYWFDKVRCLRPVPKKPAWEFHYLTNPLHFLKHIRTTLPLCSDALQQETLSLLAL